MTCLTTHRFRSYIDNEYMGYKWQCVEFARRFLFITYGFVLPDVGMAYEIFSLRYLRQVVNDAILPLQAFANGSRRPPLVGSLLIWQKAVSLMKPATSRSLPSCLATKCALPNRNVLHSPLPAGQQWTRELTLEIKDGHYILHDTFDDTTILGWMIQSDDARYSLPQPAIAGEALKLGGARLDNHGQFDGDWLDERDSLQKAYVAG
ncbi:hypothetical protein ACLK2H_16880 [Escherichia coli]